MFLIKFVMILCLAFICYQDLIYRAVYWWCFPLLAILLFILKYQFLGLGEILTHTGYGIGFLIIQLLMLWAYFSIRNRKVINLTSDYLGWGDILFLAAITFYLSPGNYVVFYVISLILVLVYTLILALFNDSTKKTHIPLAGLQAALLLVAILIDDRVSKFMLYDDSWLSF